ncbi:cobalt-zinc-cadmium efflux system membrane fusion protein [Desulfosalsimonas propionicica]|uniref:Cobalt-zinc-cadmium efflux system membrane fusion protein n=1 Tax=Desulfosalsimonas propionicica TaxID=332175 RepID=A0A7W0C9Y7_9BACT|nr:efflux RND transporter periplasmic adaptor subunit [Desulfosalsimonas propionicica]MBA2881894.1 cobalt-zinc-cadmium efflux system membrane fusion protein [Desulfosalsimonas propionicica]
MNHKGKRYYTTPLVAMAVALTIGCAVLVPPGLYAGDARAQAQNAYEHAEDIQPEDGHSENESGEEEGVHMSAAQIEEFGIQTAPAGPGEIHIQTELPGEIVSDPDRMAHVVSRVPGFTREVLKKAGDAVAAGEVLAVIDSRELADVKSEYLTARKRLDLARAGFEREKRLWNQKITSEQEFLDAKTAMAEADIQLYSAKQKLLALGFDAQYVAGLSDQRKESLTRYNITAPTGGIVTDRNLSVGEVVDSQSDVFVVADLSRVWVNLTVYQKDLGAVAKGQPVTIVADKINARAEGRIDYVSPVVDEATRTATARVILDNSDGRWRPGLFVTGKVDMKSTPADIMVPKSAIQAIDEKPVVFVRTGNGFAPAHVEIGKRNTTHVEIAAGIAPNTHIVVTHTFMLKSELKKESIGGHNH